MADVEIHSLRFKTQRGKTFFFDIKQNRNGKFVKITESIPQGGNYHRTFITVPEESLKEFVGVLGQAEEFIENGRGKSEPIPMNDDTVGDEK
jgi:hypothetical protein